jgi:PPOX class probable FMN-dependent enzyme
MIEKLAPWRVPLQRALHRNRSQMFSRYFQLATVSEEGFPTNRTVVFRGFVDDSNNLQIVTDTRSEKYQHLQHHPQGEICWYFAKTREQFRIRGQIELVTQAHQQLNQLREQAWRKLSDSGKEQFLWPHPGQPLTKQAINHQSPVALETPVSNFCLLLFYPERVDHLELRSNPHNRYLYLRTDDNNWVLKNVNP